MDIPKGPQGQNLPPDVISCAVTVAKIATGDISETLEPDRSVPARRTGGLKGGKTRAAKLSAERRREIARASAAVCCRGK